MRDKASIVPSGALVVPSATLLLLASIERTIAMIAIPKIALSLLIAETATALVRSKIVSAVLVIRKVSSAILLTGGSVPVCIHRSRLVSPPAVVVLHTTTMLLIQRLLDWRRRGYVVR